VDWIPPELHRPRLPLEIYPISAGVKGGLAGSVVMALLAMIYGIASKHGIWYPINLLAAGFFREETRRRKSLHFIGFFRHPVAVHLVTSLIVGLLYGAMLPMFPRRPILLGGFAAPLLWSGLLHSILGMVDPLLNQRIDWFWFVLSQVGFGIVAGFVVSRQVRVRTWQHLPFLFELGGGDRSMDDKSKEDQRQ